LLPLFRAFGTYPLLLRALAGEVAEYKPAPGDFDHWRRDHPRFDPSALPLKNARTHVLHFALRGLGEAQRVLHTLAAFRMPTTWDTLGALLIGEGKPCPDSRSLDAVLTELEDRGLVGWDKAANRYDLHPVVRGAIWTMLDPGSKQNLYEALQLYFEAVQSRTEDKAKTLDDLTPVIELYSSLVGLRRFDDAFKLFSNRISKPLLGGLGLSRIAAELLESLFVEGVDKISPDIDVWGRSPS